ncbi:site-specific integrase [Pseudonocardia bannensis]|uniref:Site-specific integrase n=1 Tax=Pseudonocardia bannensis TaxID=630973 RepID=A0A848DKV3_9PSEU|nr:site-specific integrase [Pseudonocardia bannensis]NMH93179.1 site-specific integrase [Pseudonocardia bannensis]
MGRLPLPIGTYGKVLVVRLGERRFRAWADYRDYDGVMRRVQRSGPTRAAAENALKSALRDRSRIVLDGEITGDTRLRVVADLWFRELDESDRALRTKITYRDAWRRLVEPALGDLRLSEVRVSTVDRAIREIRQRRGSSSAHHAKVVLAGIVGLAVRHDAIDANPVRELTPARKKPVGEKVSLSEEGLSRLHNYLAGSEDARKYDLVDLVDVLSGLGCRIGELLALDWRRINDVAGTIAIEGTVIRVPGAGLIVQSHTKSRASMRTITPPAWVMDLLRKRHADSHGPWVFPSTAGTLRDPDNTRKQLRQVLAATEWKGLHPHAFRHLVATRLDAAGLSAREIADYLGHERVSMTQDVYMTRRISGAAAGAALDGFAPR